MGYYINPQDCTKEEWLQKYGTPSPNNTCVTTTDKLLVCLVNNGRFTAAGICYNQREIDAFNDFRDTRPKMWFVVPKDKILEVCPEVARHINI